MTASRIAINILESPENVAAIDRIAKRLSAILGKKVSRAEVVRLALEGSVPGYDNTVLRRGEYKREDKETT